MELDWTQIVLAIIAAVSGGGNIMQFFAMRQYKRKQEAESDQEETKSLRLIIDGNVQEIQRLQQRVDEYAKRYDEVWQLNLKLNARISELEQKVISYEKQIPNTKRSHETK